MGLGFYIQNMAAKQWQSGKDKAVSQAKSAQAAKARGAKKASKKWGKVKVADKLNNEVFLEQKKYDKIFTEAPKILCITRGVICEKFKVNGSLARSFIRELAAKGEIKRVGDSHSKFDLWSGSKAKSALQKEAEELAVAKEKEEKQNKQKK